KRSDVHLVLARLVGLIGDPSAIRRYFRISLINSSAQERFDDALRIIEVEDLEINATIGGRLPQHELLAIGRERGCIRSRRWAFSQSLDPTSSVGGYHEKAVRSPAVRIEGNPPTVRRPDGLPVGTGIDGHARENLAGQVPDPDVLPLISHIERETPAVRRDT